MQIDSSNLVNKDIFEKNNFDKIKTGNLKDNQLKDVCDDFESFFLNQIMDVSLRSTNIAGEGPGSDIIKGMYTQTISDNATGTLGISTMLYEFLSKDNK